MNKHILLLVTVITTLVSCAKYDYDAILEQLRDHEERIQKLETLCTQLNRNVEAIQIVLEALKDNDFITDITKITEDGIEVGYSITFAKGGTVNIYHGSNGSNAQAPKISIRKAQDGEYYWTSDDEWLTDENGDKIPASVPDDPSGKYVTPQFRVAEGIWYVSFDSGNSWREIENFVGDKDCQFFQSVTYSNDYLILILSDGTEVKIPVGMDSRIVDLFIFMGQSNMSGRGDASLAPEVPEGWGYEYKAISRPGVLVHMTEPFGLNEDNATSGVDDRVGSNGTKRTGSSVAALTIAYYEQTGVPVVGVSCSKGGTATSFWMPGGKPLNDAIARQLEAENWLKDNGYTIRNNYMFWLQGESDSGLTKEKYKSNLIEIVKEMINKTGVTNCMMLRIGQQNTATATKASPIITAQTELCQEYKEFLMASTLIAGFVDDGLMKDTWHYTQEGYNILGTDAGKNVAFYSNNKIEPSMYDPYTQSLYYPISKYASIFDDDPAADDPSTNAVWYVKAASTSHSYECSTSNVTNGWFYSYAEDQAAIRNVPVNAVQFATTSTSGTVTVGIIDEFGAADVSSVYTGTFQKSSTKKEIVTVRFSSTFTLSANQYLVFEPSSVAPSRNYNFYYGSAAGNPGFYSRTPVNLEGGDIYRKNSGNSIGWSVGYIAEESPEQTIPYSSLSFACIGDSITAGSGTTKTYWQILEETLGLESMTGMGVPGSCISSKSDYGTSNSPLINRYTSIPDSDIITIFMGTNDYGHETPMGTIADKTDISFYGALNVIIPGILKAHPCSRLICMTPIHRYGFGTSKLTGTKFTYDYLPNGRNYALKDYADAIKAVCDKYSVPVIDMFEAIDLDPSISSVKSAYMPDGIHPNAAGHEIIAAAIRKYLEDSHMTEYTLTYGNDYNSSYMDSKSRVSVQPYSIYIPEGVTIVPKSGYKWGWFTEADPSSMPSGKLGSSWTTASYTGTGEAIGITIMKEDETPFDLGGADSICISDYLIASDPTIWTINGTGR